ncbi:hypothetical protein CPB86DRAFT_830123 [Serendipita vermifera]|nr:hypothetical protein CPB86DRAFT_830123 [Serendipita vermifera]
MKVAAGGSRCSGLAPAWVIPPILSSHLGRLFPPLLFLSLHPTSPLSVVVLDANRGVADKRLGGLASTVKFTSPHTGESRMVDMGLMVFNPPTYPKFLRFLKPSTVPVHPTAMSFSVTREDGAFELGGENLFTVFCQSQSLGNASTRRLLVELEKKGKECDGVDEKGREEIDVLSVGEYLKQNEYSDAFRDDYLMSTPPSECERGFSARFIPRFMHNHHLLQLIGKPKWLTIAGGSIQYVKKIIARMPRGTFRHSTPVHSVASIPPPDRTRQAQNPLTYLNRTRRRI